MRDGLEFAEDDVMRAIAEQAARMNQAIRSIAVFDGTVRSVATTMAQKLARIG